MNAQLALALTPVLEGKLAADEAVTRFLRAHPELSAEERRGASDAIFGVALWRRRLAFLAGVPEPKLAAHVSRLLEAFQRGPSDAAFPSWPVALSCPDWLASHFTRELGSEDAERFVAALNVRGPIFGRANTLRISRNALLERLTREGAPAHATEHARDGLVFEARPNIYGLPAHREGLFEVQDEGSQLLGALVEARPGEMVLDLCAGNGGKTVQLGAAMQNRGTLYAFDTDLEKLERLEHRVSRAGLTNVRVLRGLAEAVRADRVLVDAPCSSLGALRRGPDVRFRIGPEVLERDLAVQAELLETALAHLAPHGRIIYATCTLNRAENEDHVQAFLAVHPELKLVRPSAPERFHERACFRALPHRDGTDGFFAAVLER